MADFSKYPKTEMFEVIDSIGVPHPYMITHRHVAFAADKFNGIMGQAALEAAEKQGIVCDICKGKLSLAEHEQALIVECTTSGTIQEIEEPLREYLMSIEPMATADKYVGFAFKQKIPTAQVIEETSHE